VRGESDVYEAAGYARTAEWAVMTHPLASPFSQPGDERVRTIADAATEDRVLRAVLPDGGTGHPLRGGLSGNPAVRQRWVEDGGEPAAIGRLVLLGAAAYLGDVATSPPYRRRGHAAAITRRLLDDALTAGATTCVLVTTAMAYGLYQGFGFAEVMPIVEFRSPGA
jgi:ribosomal protein S18 acetylase RimI-like enzyme